MTGNGSGVQAEREEAGGGEPMRVIAGSAKGHRLISLKGTDTRPTLDRVKESLFSVIASYVPEARVLDLFSGSGSLAIEALSRGAASALCVERSRQAVRVIHKNLELTCLASKAEVWPIDVRSALRRLAKSDRRFDLVFADPPYHAGWAPQVVADCAACGIVDTGGLLVVEHGFQEELESSVENLALIRLLTYGDTRLSIYQAGEKTV